VTGTSRSGAAACKAAASTMRIARCPKGNP
jgi:hypothetical protein